jgi:hypothetical protein
VTILLPAKPRAASSIALQATIERLRKKWSLLAMKSTTELRPGRHIASESRSDPLAAEGSRRLVTPFKALQRVSLFCASMFLQFGNS